MSSEDVARTVAKKLKFYLDTQRREDAFDLSGPYHPETHPPALRPGSSLAYDGLHDRSLKHYYRDKKVKQQLQKMNTPDQLTVREKQIRRKIDTTMQEYNYKSNVSPYAQSLLQPNTNSPSPEKYYKPKRGSRRRKNPHMFVGKAPRLSRRAPEEKVHVKEQERLVNMATKLIVATETVALPKHRKSVKGSLVNGTERLPQVSDRRASSASDPGPRIQPRPPSTQVNSRRKDIHSKWEDSNSGDTSLDSTLDSVSSQMSQMKIDMRGGSYLVSTDGSQKSPTSKPESTTGNSDSKRRPKSAGDLASPDRNEFDYEDDFYDDNLPEDSSPNSSPRVAWKESSPIQSNESSTQTVESKGTQTQKNVQSPSQSRDKRGRPASASKGTQVGDIFTRDNPKRRATDIKVVSYEIFIVTGDKLGGGTSSDVKICLFGDSGDSGERPLLRSKTNKNPFERKQVDIFIVDSIFLGDLKIVRIGHNGTALGTGWFLDRVVIREGEDAERAFEFKCGRWLSARDDDGQIVRDLPLSSVISGEDVPNPAKARNSRDSFKYRPESAGSTNDKKIKFRPLSAKLGEKDGNQPKMDHVDKKEKRNLEEKSVEFPTENGTGREKGGRKISRNQETSTLERGTNDDASNKNENEETSRNSAVGDSGTVEEGQENDSSSSDDSGSESHSDSGSGTSDGMFSVSDTDSGSSDSEDEGSKNEESDIEVPIERVPKDTTKKEEPNESERKNSLKEEYMAGFLAGVQASKSETPAQEVKPDSSLTTGPNIHQASEDGDFERIKELISEIPDLKSKPDERGWTPLHIVASSGHIEILKWLSVNGVNLTEETPTGFTPIHLAAMNGHVKCIMVLSAMGCPVSCRAVDESTPLHLASMSGHVECVKWLLANRAHAQVEDIHGRTPYDLAKDYQHEECAKILKLLERELKRQNSVVSMLRQTGGKGESNADSSKGTDNGIGGPESGEDGWISDAEENASSSKSGSESLAAARARKKSKQAVKTEEELQEKRKVYEQQQKKMQRRESSFLDSIRQDIEDNADNDF